MRGKKLKTYIFEVFGLRQGTNIRQGKPQNGLNGQTFTPPLLMALPFVEKFFFAASLNKLYLCFVDSGQRCPVYRVLHLFPGHTVCKIYFLFSYQTFPLQTLFVKVAKECFHKIIDEKKIFSTQFTEY